MLLKDVATLLPAAVAAYYAIGQAVKITADKKRKIPPVICCVTMALLAVAAGIIVVATT